MQIFLQPLTASEEALYLKKYKEGDGDAKEVLITRNLRLVAHIAKKYNQQGRELEEIISVGTIGLIKAVNSFDCDKGRLGTYAARCIENEILMLLRNEKKHQKEISLYEPIGTDKDGNDMSFIDLVEENDREVHEQFELNQNIAKLYKVFYKVLDDREQYIIKHRYGIYNSDIYTQNDIAAKYSISRSYVSRIEKKALEKLRNAIK